MFRLFLVYFLLFNFLNVNLLLPLSGQLIGHIIQIESNGLNNFWKSLGDVAEDLNEEASETKSLQPSRKRISIRQVYGSSLVINTLKSPFISLKAQQRLLYIHQIIPKPEYILFLFRLTPF